MKKYTKLLLTASMASAFFIVGGVFGLTVASVLVPQAALAADSSHCNAIQDANAKRTCIQDAQSQPGPTSPGTQAPGFGSTGESCKNIPLAVDVNCSASTNNNPIYAYIAAIVRFLSWIFGLLIVLTIIISGIQYIISSDSPENFKKAKQRLTNAIIGLIFFILMAGILRYLIPGVFQ